MPIGSVADRRTCVCYTPDHSGANIVALVRCFRSPKGLQWAGISAALAKSKEHVKNRPFSLLLPAIYSGLMYSLLQEEMTL